MKVKIADGGTMACLGEFPDCRWHVQGVELITTLKVLSLGCYNITVGMDWLEQHSPMTIH